MWLLLSGWGCQCIGWVLCEVNSIVYNLFLALAGTSSISNVESNCVCLGDVAISLTAKVVNLIPGPRENPVNNITLKEHLSRANPTPLPRFLLLLLQIRLLHCLLRPYPRHFHLLIPIRIPIPSRLPLRFRCRFRHFRCCSGRCSTENLENVVKKTKRFKCGLLFVFSSSILQDTLFRGVDRETLEWSHENMR